jgi:hypothetical protein
MLPNVFISSTIADLQHLREALKDSVEELSYRPVLSEFGDIGYLPQVSAEDSCYITMRDCQIAVLIVGKRYGALSADGRGVTHNEFITARENKIPVICLVDQEVLSYKKVFDANSNKQDLPTFPGMDAPSNTFSLIQEIMDAPINNGVLSFTSVADARTLLKTQLAHIYGDLLRSKYDPVKAGIKDVLSEVMTLRQELKNKEMNPQPFLRAIRFLLDDENKELLEFVECISGGADTAVPILLSCKTFEDYLTETDTEVTIDEATIDFRELWNRNDVVSIHSFRIPNSTPEEPAKIGKWCVLRGKKAIMNAFAKRFFDYTYEYLRRTAGV